VSTLKANAETFAELVEIAEDFTPGSDDALAWVQVAARFAWRQHPGLFVSPRLEACTGATGAMPGRPSRSTAGHGRIERVLHVATELYPTGGHTRLLTRWVEQDTARSHTVVLTGAVPPPPTSEAARASADAPVVSVFRGRDLRAAASALHAVTSEHDVVILHAHPFDVVPVVAFGEMPRPPVLLVNHADHRFWLGAHDADVLAGLRESGTRLSVTRRGLDPARGVEVAIPLQPPDRLADRAAAKARIGVDPDTCVLLTMATGYKYAAPEGEGLVDLVLPAIERERDALLVAVGPVAQPAWERAAAEGHVRLLAPTEHVGDLLAAADVYLDSYPFASNTSLLEAVLHGAAPVSFQPPETRGTVLAADAPSLDELLRPATPDELADVLRRLVADPHERTRVADAMRAAVEAHHTGAGWRAGIDAAYAAVTAAHAEGPYELRALGSPDALDDALVTLGDAAPEPLDVIVREHTERWQHGDPMPTPPSRPVPTG
jgi:hypothetical protein